MTKPVDKRSNDDLGPEFGEYDYGDLPYTNRHVSKSSWGNTEAHSRVAKDRVIDEVIDDEATDRLQAGGKVDSVFAEKRPINNKYRKQYPKT